ncbi:MAG TPA: hypothetical protein VKT78_00365 [Fimbriimonadaceae bacterium]|nr:hypothetical protein [Fimbriimonadaceae bacterium]
MRGWTRATALVAVLSAGCGASFYKAVTPSGGLCADMPVIVWGKEIPPSVHRLGAVASDLKCETNTERFESLRRKACDLGADAVIEVTADEVHTPTRNIIRIDGMAVRYDRSTVQR